MVGAFVLVLIRYVRIKIMTLYGNEEDRDGNHGCVGNGNDNENDDNEKGYNYDKVCKSCAGGEFGPRKKSRC